MRSRSAGDNLFDTDVGSFLKLVFEGTYVRTPFTPPMGHNLSWIEDDNGKVYVDDGRGHRVDVKVVTPPLGPKYLRTYADGIPTDNLLYLPRR